MRCAIIGVGALGGVIAGALAKLDDVALLFVARGDQADALSTSGLRFEHPDGSLTSLPADRWTTLRPHEAPLAEWKHGADLVLLTAKAAATADLAPLAAALLGPAGLALSLQNGLGHADLLATHLGPARVAGATTTHGATRLAPGHIRWAGRGEVVLGPRAGATAATHTAIDQTHAILQRAGLAPRLSQDIDGEIWLKLALNAAINPIAALAGVPNGHLLEQPELLAQAHAVIDEVHAVATATGLHLDAAHLHARLEAVLQATAHNRCSMLQDLDAGRPTEIAQLNGAVVALAAEHGIPVPRTSALAALVGAHRHPAETSPT